MFFNSSSELSVEKAFFWLIAVFLYVELDINPFVVEDAVPNSPPTTDKMAKKIEANPHWIASIYATKI